MREKHFASLDGFIDLLLDAVCIVDAEGDFVYVSAAFERIFGYTPAEVIGTPVMRLIVPEDRERTALAATRIMSGRPQLDFENRYVRKDGQIVHIRWTARWSETDKLRVAVAHDITERKHAETLQDAVYAISEAAHTAKDLFGLFQRVHQIIGRLLPADNFSVAMRDSVDEEPTFTYQVDESRETPAEHTKTLETFCLEILNGGVPLLRTSDSSRGISYDLHDRPENNTECWLGTPLISDKETIGAIVLKSYSSDCRYTEKDKDLLQFVSIQIATAIERKRLQERLQYMAQFDGLTGLPNRGLVCDRLDLALARAHRQNGKIAVLYLDLDNFKQVNDSMGHAAGDSLLKQMTLRLKQRLRDCDTVGRMGGDEFVVVLEGIRHSDCARIVAEKIRRAVSEPVEIDNNTVRIQASVGYSLYPKDGDNAEQLLKVADQAMYREKNKRE